MKRKNLLVGMLSVLTLGVVTSCGPASSESTQESPTPSSIPSVDDVTIADEDFVVEEDFAVDLGATVQVEPAYVRDSGGGYHLSVITVTDPSGAAVVLASDNSFVAAKVGVYTITHTITYGANGDKVATKSTRVTVSDASAPTLDVDSIYHKENLIKLGDTVDLSNILISDNSGETITPKFTVSFGEEPIETTNNTFVADRKGCYDIHVEAKDSSGNEANLTVKVFTVVDGEQGLTLTNQYQGGVSLGDVAYNGEHSSAYHWTSEHPEWINGNALLAEDCQIISNNPKYLSFWYYLDVGSYESAVYSVSKYTYFDTKCYNAFGEALPNYWQFPYAYEIPNNSWTRFVLDLSNATNEGADGNLAVANPKNLVDVLFGFGIWDNGKGANATTPYDIYIDDIMLSDETPTDYHSRPAVSSITLNETSLTLEVGDGADLVATVSPSDAGDKSVTWTSSDPTVASVSNGSVVALSKGSTTITATSVSNPAVSASCEVTVNANTSVTPKPDATNAITIDHQFDIYGAQVENLGHLISGRYDLVDYGVGHGTFSSYEIMGYTSDAGLVGYENPALNSSNEPTNCAAYQTWRFFYNNTDGIVYSVVAKEACFVKISEPAAPGGWVEGQAHYAVKRIDGNVELLETRVLEGKSGIFACDYIYLEEGETFVWDVVAWSADMRNVQNSPDIVVAPVYLGE